MKKNLFKDIFSIIVGNFLTEGIFFWMSWQLLHFYNFNSRAVIYPINIIHHIVTISSIWGKHRKAKAVIDIRNIDFRSFNFSMRIIISEYLIAICQFFSLDNFFSSIKIPIKRKKYWVRIWFEREIGLSLLNSKRCVVVSIEMQLRNQPNECFYATFYSQYCHSAISFVPYLSIFQKCLFEFPPG